LASQIALHSKLRNPFVQWDLTGLSLQEFAARHSAECVRSFEDGLVQVFDGFQFKEREFLFAFPSKQFPEWVPPVPSRNIFSPIGPNHRLREYYDDSTIRALQPHIAPFEASLMDFENQVFSGYQWTLNEFSYRFNEMGLGQLHLDIPDQEYREHQFRLFINLDHKPRILTIGPSLQDLSDTYWKDLKLDEIAGLPLGGFIAEFRRRTLENTVFHYRELPRHYLTLDPGSMWLAHSSLITHGLVWGRKTACLEGHIRPHSLANPARNFATQVAGIIAKHSIEVPA